MSGLPDVEEGVIYRVRCQIQRNGRNIGVFDCDLIFEKGQPLLVFEWDRKDGEEAPSAAVRLDPTRLFHLPGWQPSPFFGYQDPVDDPRPLN